MDHRCILALDPALSTGFAHSNGESGVWDLRGPEGEHEGARLHRLRVLLDDSIRAWGAEMVAFENAAYGSRYMRTQVFHSALRGVIELVAYGHGCELRAYAPATIKKFATGNGRAKKDQLVRACVQQFGIKPRDDNEADALFILEMAKHGVTAQSKPKAKRRTSQPKKEPTLF